MLEYTIRPLKPSDSSAGLKLSIAASWNQTEQDWQRILALSPDGCWGLYCDAHLVSSATAICYGNDMAWIGMVLTEPPYRGRGFARLLINRCLEFLEGRKVPRIRLDATDGGEPLYRSLGFREEYEVERWKRSPETLVQNASGLGPFRLDARLDRAAFGADRSRLLEMLSAAGSVSFPDHGYAMCRPGNFGPYFGPCVSDDVQVARELLIWFLASHSEETVYWDLIRHNHAALELAQDFGFERVRTLTRMIRQPAASSIEDATSIYALAGFEFG